MTTEQFIKKVCEQCYDSLLVKAARAQVKEDTKNMTENQKKMYYASNEISLTLRLQGRISATEIIDIIKKHL